MALMVGEMIRSCHPKRELRSWRAKSHNNHEISHQNKSSVDGNENGEKLASRRRRASQQHILEAIAKGGNHEVRTFKADDGTLKMKILVKKQHLQQILAAAEATIVNCNNNQIQDCKYQMSQSRLISNTLSSSVNNGNNNNNNNSNNITSSIEQRLYNLMKSRKSRSFTRRRDPLTTPPCAWRPALHSIPEEH